MTGRIRVFASACALLALLAIRTPLMAAGNTASATGSGHFHIGDELRTFSFSAVKNAVGNARGEGELHNRAQDLALHLKINCLSIVGNTATVTGKISDSNNPALIGLDFYFKAADNGEGANAPPDEISLVFFFFGPGPTCSTNLAVPLIAIEGGNIQVH